jgi:hypothetical protein
MAIARIWLDEILLYAIYKWLREIKLHKKEVRRPSKIPNLYNKRDKILSSE